MDEEVDSEEMNTEEVDGEEMNNKEEVDGEEMNNKEEENKSPANGQTSPRLATVLPQPQPEEDAADDDDVTQKADDTEERLPLEKEKRHGIMCSLRRSFSRSFRRIQRKQWIISFYIVDPYTLILRFSRRIRI